jgi:hypothetical protein
VDSGLDFTYNSAPIYYWTAVEINVALVVGCAITLKPFIRHFMPSLIFSKVKSTTTENTTGNKPLRGTGASGSLHAAPVKNNQIRINSSFTAQYGRDSERLGGYKAEISSEHGLKNFYMV